MDIPRPREFRLAPQDRLAVVEPWAPRFFEEVLRRDYSECLITDESTLWDFLEDEAALSNALTRFRAHYFIEPPTDGTTYIVALLELLRERGVAAA